MIGVADQETYEFLKNNCDENTHIIKLLLRKPRNVLQLNKYHKSECIFLKFEVIRKAVESFGSTVFCDSDLFIFEPFNSPQDCSVALSHNLATSRDIAKNANSEGVFNAGLIYTNDLEFVSWWENRFLTGKGFYEQRCLNEVPGMFRTDYFDTKHNYGWWRSQINKKTIHSAHCHLSNNLDDKMHKMTLLLVERFRKEIKEYIKTQPKVNEIYNSIFNS